MSDNKLNLIVQFMALDNLSSTMKGIIGLGKTGKQELAGMKREAVDLNKQMAGVTREIGGATGNVTKLIDRERALGAAIQSVNGRIEQRARLNAIDARTAAIKQRSSQLVSEGQAGLMGAAMMAAPLYGVIKESQQYEREMARIDALGLGEGISQHADKFARSAHIIGNSTRDIAHAYGDALSIFKNTKEADFVTPFMAKMKFANHVLYGEEGSHYDEALMSLMKVIEARGGTKSEQSFAQQAEFAQKVVNGSRGRVNGEQMLQVMQTGGILAKTMTDKAMYLDSEPLMQEVGGHRFGTGLSAIYSNIGQGHGTLAAQREMLRLGLLDRTKVQFNAMGKLKKFQAGAFDLSSLRNGGVQGLVMNTLMPAFAKAGIKGDQAIVDEIGRIFSGKAASLVATAYLQRDKLKIQSDANEKAMGITDSTKAAKNTFAGKSADLVAKWQSFEEVLGKKGGVMDAAAIGLTKIA